MLDNKNARMIMMRTYLSIQDHLQKSVYLLVSLISKVEKRSKKKAEILRRFTVKIKNLIEIANDINIYVFYEEDNSEKYKQLLEKLQS